MKSIKYAGDGYWNISYTDNTQDSIPGPEIPEEKPDIESMEYDYDNQLWSINYTDGSSSEISGPLIPGEGDYMPAYGGVFSGMVSAMKGTTAAAQLRNTALVSADTNPTVNGQINWTYS